MARQTRINLARKVFGRLTVVSYSHVDTYGLAHWNCRCECGKKLKVLGTSLRSGNTKSCGCFKIDLLTSANKTHGMSKTKTYKDWERMIRRCENKSFENYNHYGGRGIKVCERWHKFENFLSDMGEKPEGKTLDRIDNDGNYEPGNCKWATGTEQARNKRDVPLYEVKGVKKSIAEWSEISGINRETIRCRIKKRGWNVERAIFEKPKMKAGCV